jgi:hypothetical protein
MGHIATELMRKDRRVIQLLLWKSVQMLLWIRKRETCEYPNTSPTHTQIKYTYLIYTETWSFNVSRFPKIQTPCRDLTVADNISKLMSRYFINIEYIYITFLDIWLLSTNHFRQNESVGDLSTNAYHLQSFRPSQRKESEAAYTMQCIRTECIASC